MSPAATRIITPTDIFRVVLGWGGFAVLLLAGPILDTPLPLAALTAILAGIITVITVCAFGVVKQAEALAHRLGDPYGSLVLTLSIVMIEVILIGAVMLGPGEHTTIARDSVMAVAMIIMNLVIGLSLLAGGLRHGSARSTSASPPPLTHGLKAPPLCRSARSWPCTAPRCSPG